MYNHRRIVRRFRDQQSTRKIPSPLQLPNNEERDSQYERKIKELNKELQLYHPRQCRQINVNPHEGLSSKPSDSFIEVYLRLED